ncbi:uncharacterized protein UV8b_04953 [Ustilaginoidea virens]|uniref:Uncharacterized protein n=1 Tax=Ustilaginoidea virens TaxID=1159556 RepID=A0A8E5HSJ6_USTVR|nr:uncharacterized protein UV8b_04953 [Ustilaginoidea virens]QUC20712.1 hypothetical protein UV8b_04953 [Ustilaginoidea virens]
MLPTACITIIPKTIAQRAKSFLFLDSSVRSGCFLSIHEAQSNQTHSQTYPDLGILRKPPVVIVVSCAIAAPLTLACCLRPAACGCPKERDPSDACRAQPKSPSMSSACRVPPRHALRMPSRSKALIEQPLFSLPSTSIFNCSQSSSKETPNSASVRAVETCRIVMLVRDLTVSLFFQIHWKPPRFRLCLQFLHVSV